MNEEYYDELVSRRQISIKVCAFCGEHIIGRERMTEHIKLKHKRKDLTPMIKEKEKQGEKQ